MIGLDDETINLFDGIDREQFRGKLLSCCQPNIDFKRHLHNIGVSKFIIFYVKKSTNKPHIFTQSMGHIKAGDIFFRYNDSIKKIQHAELSEIIDFKRQQEQNKWMSFLGQIASIGLDNVLIVDCKKGRLVDANGTDLSIDEGLFENLKFVKEGHFVENKGAPTLKLIGNVLIGDRADLKLSTNVSGALDVNKTHPYTQRQIYNMFLEKGVYSSDRVLLTKINFTIYRVQAMIALQNLKEDLNLAVALKYNGIIYKYSEKMLLYLQEFFSGLKYSEIVNIKMPNVSKRKTGK